VEPVVNADGGMKHLPDARAFLDGPSQPGEILQKVDVVK
jgi:hypothetical protein